MIHKYEASYDTDRSARNVKVCRYFLRSVLSLLSPALDSIARVEEL